MEYNLGYVEKLIEKVLSQSEEDGREGLAELVSIGANISENGKEVSNAAYDGASNVFSIYIQRIIEKSEFSPNEEQLIAKYGYCKEAVTAFATLDELETTAEDSTSKRIKAWNNLGRSFERG